MRSTQPQTELNRQARLDNVNHAFELDPLRAQEVAGRKIILVDDVMTSGATLFFGRFDTEGRRGSARHCPRLCQNTSALTI